jgi:glycosyltransferase A (GT-A) superfamily protein (DUF2064 family)
MNQITCGWHLLVMAKEPVPGRVKTRLSPPLSPSEAASVAEAALADTLAAVAACGADRKLVALDGEPGPWLPPGFTVIPQHGDGFAARLALAWRDAGGPGLQIGMDTPQVTPALLDACLAATADPNVSATLGLALDGGWWALGLSERWQVDVFAGVPMSTSATGAHQLASLRAHGYRIAELPVLIDVDTVTDARQVAAQAPFGRFARRLETVNAGMGTAAG